MKDDTLAACFIALPVTGTSSCRTSWHSSAYLKAAAVGRLTAYVLAMESVLDLICNQI